MKASSIGVAYRLSQSTDPDDAYILNEHEPLPDNPLKKSPNINKINKNKFHSISTVNFYQFESIT